MLEVHPASDLVFGRCRSDEFDISPNARPPKRKISKLRRNKKSDHIATEIYTTNEEMTALGVPKFLQNSYLNGWPAPRITALRDWQKDLISSTDWKENRNTIVLVPTSGGKTLAADVAIAQQLEKDPDSKVIYALPFVSLASEKTEEFRARFASFQVRPFYQNIGGPDFRRGSIAICTFEKVHSLLNCAIKDSYIDKFKLIVIDEIHMIGEEHRGAVIEAIIVKALLLKPHLDIRIIGLTATLNTSDAMNLAKWIQGFAHISDSRPSRIKHYFKAGNGDLFLINSGEKRKLLNIKSIQEDKKHILNPIRTILFQKPSSTILVFVNTRKQTMQVADFIAKHIYDQIEGLPSIQQPDPRLQASRNLVIQRLSRTDTGLDKLLGECVKKGVAYHHAGMLLEERKLIEEAARDSTISIIVATTTLSAGINIRSVARVIIYDIYRTLPDRKRVLIPSATYTQMAGRAGRNEGQCGDVMILSQSVNDEREMNDALQLAKQQLEGIHSHLLDNGVADRFFLQCLVTGLLSPDDGLKKFVKCSFEAFISDNINMDEVVESIANRLRKAHLIEENSVAATPLGQAIAGSSLSIDEGLELKEAIDNLQDNLCLNDEVHLLYLCVPPSAISAESTPPYDHEIWEKLVDEHRQVLNLITKMTDQSFEKHLILTLKNGGKRLNTPDMTKRDRELDRFFFACLLQKLIAENPINEIVNLFLVTRGSVQSLQMQAATFAGQSVRFCETTGCRTLGRALNTFRERLNFGVKNELLPLMKLPSCNRQTARVLISNRIPTPMELVDVSEEDIAVMLSKSRGSEMPSYKEKELAAKLKDESRQVAKSLSIIDDLENHAVANTLGELYGRRI